MVRVFALAVLALLAPLEGGGVMFSAKQFYLGRCARAAWRNPYVTDGLVAQYDGEWNAGGGVPFAITDRSVHTVSAAWGNGNGAPATSGNIDGVSRLVTNLTGTGRDGDNNFIVGGLAPFQPPTYGMKGRIYSIRLYSRALTSEELAANCAIDKERFNQP